MEHAVRKIRKNRYEYFFLVRRDGARTKVSDTLKSITINSVTIWKPVIPDRIVKMSNFVQVSSLMSQQ